ncbi:hypothetical protein C8R46DRAFT_1138232, partial [Mycena filopes]
MSVDVGDATRPPSPHAPTTPSRPPRVLPVFSSIWPRSVPCLGRRRTTYNSCTLQYIRGCCARHIDERNNHASVVSQSPSSRARTPDASLFRGRECSRRRRPCFFVHCNAYSIARLGLDTLYVSLQWWTIPRGRATPAYHLPPPPASQRAMICAGSSTMKKDYTSRP